VEFNPLTLRVLPLYFLMPSPPDKSGIFESKVFVCINPFVLWTLPYVYSETPHNATGHGKEERERCITLFPLSKVFTLLPCVLHSKI